MGDQSKETVWSGQRQTVSPPIDRANRSDRNTLTALVAHQHGASAYASPPQLRRIDKWSNHTPQPRRQSQVGFRRATTHPRVKSAASNNLSDRLPVGVCRQCGLGTTPRKEATS
jgi:hypothetical protein